MSSPKYKLHFASSIIQTLKEIKTLFIPAFIVLAANGFRININSFESVMELIPVIIILGIFVYTIFQGIIKWLTFTYWVEDQELKTEYGFLLKKKRYVPMERIQNVNYNEGIIHRIFNLVQLSIETAGGSSAKADIELSAITKEAAGEVERWINQSTSPVEKTEGEAKSRTIYKMNNQDLLLLATTSNGIGVVLAGVGAVLSQFSQYIPFELITSQFSFLLKYGFMLVIGLIILALLISWAISVAMTYLAYYSFTLSFSDDQLEITRGLLEKKKVTIPINKIQAIKIVENPIRQLFGYAHVSIENAGASMTSASEKKIILLPFIKKKQIEEILQLITPTTSFDMEDAIYSPVKARPLFYRKFIWIITPITIALAIWVSTYFLLLFIMLALIVSLCFSQHRNASFKLENERITIQYRVINKVTFIVQRNKIQALQMTQTIFQKRLGIYTGVIHVMGNMGGVKAKIVHQSKDDLKPVYHFIQKRDV